MLRNYYRRYKTTEYKFKVWDLTSHTVLKCHTLEEYAKWNFGTYDFSRLYIMQFTGLHDRYHNEIYTHEVLKTPLLIGEVVFDVEKQKMFIVGKKDKIPFDLSVAIVSEVIGNSFQMNLINNKWRI